MDHHYQQSRKQMVSPEVAMAAEVFDQFCNAATLKSILGHFRHLCDLLKIKPTNIHQFYPKLKSKLRSWKAQALWKKFDQRANHKCYNRGKACLNTRVLIIGGGPCGMRSAIEAQLLGAKVVVVEKRDRMSRNNVLHLWPFVIHDLRGLGAKKFFGKFCAGSIDHISIRQLQCILLKVALILGVEFHENVSFESLVPPPEDQEGGKIGWRAETTPADHPVSQYEFDVLIGADGKRNTLEGFKRKEFRGKLAIAITANFINKRTEAEARVEEISGVAFIFNQKFFKELYSETGIDLENIVYYKDDTHYFVMTAKKHSLIDKGVILQDHPDTAKLLAKENVDREALMMYAREAAEFSTEYQMMDMEFAVNHYGQPDVAMFDFTSMYAAENASRVLERRGHRLLQILVGDSLLEPFWPTGSGCARGFLSSLDAGWAIKAWGAGLTPLEVIAERESIYRLLGQTTPENLNRDYAAYTLDPHTRYPNLNVRCVTSTQVRTQLDTDDPETFKLQPVQTAIDLPKKRRRRDSQVHPETLLHWLQRQVALYDGVRIHDMGASFKSGLAIAAIINRYRPDLVDFHALKKDDPAQLNQLVFDVLEKELGITSIMTGEEMVQSEVPDKLLMFSYLTQIYEAFRGEIPHIKHPKLEPETEERPSLSQKLSELSHKLAEQKTHLMGSRTRRSRHSNENLPPSGDKKLDSSSRRHTRKRRSTEKMGATVEERTQRLMDIEKNRVDRMLRRQAKRKQQTEQFYKSMHMLRANAKRDKDEPFEDYSIYLYRQTAPDFKDRIKDLEMKILYPDREPKLHAGHRRSSIDEGFSGRIKNIEDKLRGTPATEKKPKDLLRAIGKIEKSDWNVKEIEKKIEENKMGRGVKHEKVERVPKWSREQFLARQTKMEKRGKEEPMETESKYAEIDSTLKNIDRKIREGNVLGHNKVSAMAEQFASKNQETDAPGHQVEQSKVQRSNSKAALALPAQGGSETCHFCEKRVYLMERLTAEGKSFHRGCFKCEYCSTSLRIGNHTFDRDKNGGRFYCTQHFGLPGTMKTRSDRKKLPLTNKENIPHSSNNLKSLDKTKLSVEGISGLDLLDRGQTPERIEFENLAGISDAEDAHSIMDEDEWTDRNFGPSAAEMGSSDDISDMSDSDEDNEVFEEAIDQPLTTEGTLELAKNWTLRYSHPHPAAANSDTGSNEYEDSSDEYTSTEEDSQTATEDEDDARARELRKQEVWLKLPPRSSDTETGSETEVKHPNIINGASTDRDISTPPILDIFTLPIDSTEPYDFQIELPDGIPNGHSPPIAEVESSTIINLPDLVTSSPKLSRHSSMRSSSSSFASLEDSPNAKPDLSVRIIPSPDTGWLEVEAALSKEPSLEQPVLMITAPTPTTERPAETSKSVESSSSRLVVPKEKSPTRKQEEEIERSSPTSFDQLILELKLRKAKNKAEAEAQVALKPLTTETAKMQMSRFFATPKRGDETLIDADNEKVKSAELNDEIEPKLVEFKVSPKLSDKVDKKDLLKYFGGSSFDRQSDDGRKHEILGSSMEKTEETEMNAVDDVPDDFQIDDIEREFREIERQNKNNMEVLESVNFENAPLEVDVDLFDNYLETIASDYAEYTISDLNLDNIDSSEGFQLEHDMNTSLMSPSDNLEDIFQYNETSLRDDCEKHNLENEREITTEVVRQGCDMDYDKNIVVEHLFDQDTRSATEAIDPSESEVHSLIIKNNYRYPDNSSDFEALYLSDNNPDLKSLLSQDMEVSHDLPHRTIGSLENLSPQDNEIISSELSLVSTPKQVEIDHNPEVTIDQNMTSPLLLHLTDTSSESLQRQGIPLLSSDSSCKTPHQSGIIAKPTSPDGETSQESSHQKNARLEDSQHQCNDSTPLVAFHENEITPELDLSKIQDIVIPQEVPNQNDSSLESNQLQDTVLASNDSLTLETIHGIDTSPKLNSTTSLESTAFQTLLQQTDVSVKNSPRQHEIPTQTPESVLPKLDLVCPSLKEPSLSEDLMTKSHMASTNSIKSETSPVTTYGTLTLYPDPNRNTLTLESSPTPSPPNRSPKPVKPPRSSMRSQKVTKPLPPIPQPIKRTTIVEQKLLPVRVTEVMLPQRQSAILEDYRTSSESPVEDRRSSGLRRTLSLRSYKFSGSPSPSKKNGSAALDTDSLRSSQPSPKPKKDRCIIS